MGEIILILAVLVFVVGFGIVVWDVIRYTNKED